MTIRESSPTATDRSLRDTRGYWRVLLAICAPTGWLTVGILNAVTPYPLAGTTAENISGIAEHTERMRVLLGLQPLFLFTFVPGVIALVVVCRRACPTFTAVLGTVGILGALAGTFNPPIDLFVLAGLENGVGSDQLAAVSDAIENGGPSWTLLCTLVFITVGRVAAGVLLWKAGVGPRLLAVLMAVSPLIEFGGDAVGLGNGAPAAAWIASGIAMFGVSATLFRMRDDDFDLAPAVPARRATSGPGSAG